MTIDDLGNLADIMERRPHRVAWYRCPICGSEAHHVYPDGLLEIECGKCRGFFPTYEAPKGGLRLVREEG